MDLKLIRETISWRGELGRGAYVAVGLTLFLIKWNLDRLVSGYFFSVSWMPYRYLVPGLEELPEALQGRQDLLLTLALTSLPFIYVGILFTVKRLRSIGAPVFLAALFFIPFINLLFFAVLSVLPPRDPEEAVDVPPPCLERMMPKGRWANFFLSAWASVLAAVPVLAVGVYYLQSYGWGVFVGIPFMIGLMSSLLHAVHQRRGFLECLSVAMTACGLFGMCVFFLAMEGIICLIMAAFIAVPLCCLGALVGYGIQSSHHASRVPPVLLLTCLMLMGFEKMESPKPVPYAVTSTVEVEAPPEVVWRHVVSFSELPPVEDWIFKTGLAYPIRADIQGEGVGAVRHCVCSTGACVEPITVWDEPRHLRFDVTAMPEPMQEWTFYSEVHPPHLEGYFQTTQGEFVLERLPGGRTCLHGTTWYHNDLWPASYWKVWSDHLIHRIHLRVLRHVKQEAEADAAATGPSSRRRR